MMTIIIRYFLHDSSLYTKFGKVGTFSFFLISILLNRTENSGMNYEKKCGYDEVVTIFGPGWVDPRQTDIVIYRAGLGLTLLIRAGLGLSIGLGRSWSNTFFSRLKCDLRLKLLIADRVPAL